MTNEPYTGTHVVQLTDTTDRNAFLKIRSAYARHLGRQGIRDALVDVEPAENSVKIGTLASELVTNTERPGRLILALNYAPPDKKDGTQNNARNDFFCADLGDGVTASGTSNGFEFSYIKPQIKELYRLTNTNSKKSQFRSLEILPEHALAFSDPERRKDLIASGVLELVENVDSIVPSLPDRTHVLEVDNFGNVKLHTSPGDRKALEQQNGQKVKIGFHPASIEIAGRSGIVIAEPRIVVTAQVTPTLFAAPLGTDLIAQRSSSRRVDGNPVPIIATIRDRPAETRPSFKLPKVGNLVTLGL